MSEEEPKKVNIKFPSLEMEKFNFNGEKIEFRPYFTINEKIAIISKYVRDLNDENSEDDDLATRYIKCEYALIMEILDLCTNVDISNLHVDEIILSGLWDELKSKFTGYDGLRKDLSNVLEFYQTRQYLTKSVGSVLDNFSVKISNFLDMLSEMDIENFKEISGQFNQQLSILNDNLPGIVENSNVGSKSKPKQKRKYIKKEKLDK